MLTILTPFGKISANARGIRKTASRLAGHLELLSFCQLQLAIGKSRDVVTQSVAIERFEAIQQRLYTMAASYYLTELTDNFVTDSDIASPALTHLLASLHMLCQPSQIEMVMHWYTLQLSDVAGYRPQLFDCAVCGSRLDEQTDRWSIAQGGMLCPDCVALILKPLPLVWRCLNYCVLCSVSHWQLWRRRCSRLHSIPAHFSYCSSG